MWMAGSSPAMTRQAARGSTTSRRRPAGVAFEARAVAHEREIIALGAGFAGVSLHPRFAALGSDARALGRHRPVELAELRLDLVFEVLFERRRPLSGALHEHQLIGFRAHETFRDEFRRTLRRAALILALAEHVMADIGRIDMGEIVAAEIGDREFPEDVIDDRGRILDRVIALDETGRLEPREDEGIDIFLRSEEHTSELQSRG